MPRIASRVSPALLALLFACAQPPLEPTADDVDAATGVSVARRARPIELIATSSAGRNDPFAYVGPFETNRMGERALYLWMASQQPTQDQGPTLLADGEAVAMGELQPGVEPMGLSKSPYMLPAPWSLERYYRIDRTVVEQLARAGRVELVVRDPEGSEVRYAADAAALQSLADFVARLQ
jgi:hypothetical protein